MVIFLSQKDFIILYTIDGDLHIFQLLLTAQKSIFYLVFQHNFCYLGPRTPKYDLPFVGR